jgi:hypothetical protein
MECRVFICYRRADTGAAAGPLADKLAQRFGSGNVFLDKGLRPGDDFWEEIQRFLRAADVVLTLIGSEWLGARGQPRPLADRGDYLRREILLAWKHGTRVMPVLVQPAKMPAKRDLPPALARIAGAHAIELHTDTWRHDTDIIIKAIEDHVREGRRGRFAPLQTILAQEAPLGSLLKNAVTRPANWLPLVLLLTAAWRFQAIWLWAIAGLVFILLCTATFFDLKDAKRVARTHTARQERE